MIFTTIDATVEQDGVVRLSERVRLPHRCRAILTILDYNEPAETALLSENVLAEDWNRPEEDEAWAHFQKGR